MVPLHPMLANALAEWQPKDVQGQAPVFVQCINADQIIRRHMEKAGIERFDAMKRKLDFHALRYAFATKLAQKGISQRLAQELMRHSDPRLTASIYTDASRLPTFEAVGNLAWPQWKDGKSASACDPQIAPQKADFSGVKCGKGWHT